ncbi:hypothetical protein K450DRAFT_258860 [Umbelopsis ramanniana AG]|uniref:Uncharacterized protein n=1 Tax=Umbelopsis ramanniana AG TaxID=1314678 RepID=A0AAD5E3E1_UMBRA|nr:uncharacterized protein K450DRAFT_258860 [Umbelopsis ramanniana AG]KAI8575994.1 hypothetical protein K450DRAFT_258860 [Umbelopsis ramanniana AG]
MKFAKKLETDTENLPDELRKHLIRYKYLKKAISKIVDEMEQRGLSATLLSEWLRKSSGETEGADDDSLKIEYFFVGQPPDIRTCIRITYLENDPRIQQLLKPTEVAGNDQEVLPTPLEFRYSKDDTDYFSLSPPPLSVLSDQQLRENVSSRRESSSSAKLAKTLLQLSLNESKEHNHQPRTSEHDGIEEIERTKTLVIELEQDDEFFQMLMRELNEITDVQEEAKNKFEKDVYDMESKLSSLVTVAKPKKSDLYTWREIFRIYMDAEVFQGSHELDRSLRSAEKSRQQMEWFTAELRRLNLIPKIMSKGSRRVYEQFLALNAELINIKQFQAMNQLAMFKILKKHDKRSGLNASSTFPNLASTDVLFNTKLSKLLYASVTDKLVTIVPQPDDYSCPICMSIAWRPIRLVCGHIFCVRCLIKQQRKNMPNCPVCRKANAVRFAGADQLDVELETKITTYFPKEIKEKRKDNDREQAIEDVQAMTGRKYSPEQLQRMQNERGCIIM